MTTLERQLAQYGRRQRELHGPIGSDELVTRLDRPDDPARIGPADVVAADADHFAVAALDGDPSTNESDEGELIMVDLQTRETDTGLSHDDKSQRRWIPYVVLAAAAVLLVVAAVSLFDGGEENTTVDVVDSPDPATDQSIELDADAEEALAVVEAAFAAFNSGDMDTWALWREPGPPLVEEVPTGADFDYELAVGSRLDVDQCTYRGFEEWRLPDGPLTGHGIECAVTQTDSVLQDAGIELEMTYLWVIGEDPESSIGGSNEDWTAPIDFYTEFFNWLSVTYPDVFAATAVEEFRVPFDPDNPDPEAGPIVEFIPVPEGVPTVLEYVDEFVAQSETYPLTEPVPQDPGPFVLVPMP